MEVEAETERPDPCLGLEDEDLSSLSLPPPLSITEEILQFINQSRVREGMAELKHDIVWVGYIVFHNSHIVKQLPWI